MNLDFYLRVSMAELHRMRFEHLETALDMDDDPVSDACGPSAPPGFNGLSGYTEWATPGLPSASLGWDWVMPLTAKEAVLRRHSIRTNLRVTHADGSVLGETSSLEMLRTMIETLPWKRRVVESLRGCEVQR